MELNLCPSQIFSLISVGSHLPIPSDSNLLRQEPRNSFAVSSAWSKARRRREKIYIIYIYIYIYIYTTRKKRSEKGRRKAIHVRI